MLNRPRKQVIRIFNPTLMNLYQQFYRFLQPPPDVSLNTVSSYQDKRTELECGHSFSFYIRIFIRGRVESLCRHENNNIYLNLFTTGSIFNVTGSQRVKLENTMGMVVIMDVGLLPAYVILI